MADLTISVELDGKKVKGGADDVNKSVRAIGDEAEKTSKTYVDASGRMRDANGRFAKSADDAKRSATSLAKTDYSGAISQLKNFGDRITSIGSQISGLGQTLTLVLTTAVLTIATFGITSQANLEKAEVSFTRFIKNTKGFTGTLGDARKEAQLLMKDLQAFADTTPFESEEVIASGRKLLAAKIPREEIKGFLKDAGDLAAAANTGIEDVTGAMSRLKSGDFGEAFERFRDFGISKEDLTSKGLKFDKGGSFKGSADEAMKAVREIIKERFGDTMDDLSQTLSGRFSTLIDKGTAFFRELFLPAFEYAKPAIDFVVARIETLTAYLAQMSPQAKLIIVGILGGLAALGPVLVVIGTIITAIGGLIGAITTIAGAWATVSAAIVTAGGVFAAIGAVFTATIIPALVVLAKVALPVIAVIGALVAVGAALYFAWSTNFGGLRDFTNEVFTAVQNLIQSALENILAFWNTYRQQIIQTAVNAFNSLIEFLRPIVTAIVNYLREGFQTIVEVAGPIWTQLVTLIKNQLTILSSGVRVVLTAITNFWEAHGEQIKSIASAIWTILKTIVLAGIRQVANVITLVLAVINGDWKQAWESFRAIIQTGVNASLTILKSLGTLIVSALSFVGTRLYNIGKDIIQGLINGLKSGATEVYNTATGLANQVIGIFRSVTKVQSPSKVTTEIGEFIAEGLTVGINNKSAGVIGAARKLAAEVIKEFKNAVDEFNKLAGASPETVRTIQQTTRFKDAANSQQEIIKLRGELGVNQFKSLPTTLSGTDRELKYLQSLKTAADDFNKSLEEISKGADEVREAMAKAAAERQEAFDNKIQSIQQNGELALINLREEISLVGVTDEFEKQRIQNYYEIQRLREQMNQDGFDQQQIDAAAETLRLEQARQLELQKILQVNKQLAEAGSIEKNLLGQLSTLQNGNRELSEYEKTLQKINTDLSEISPAQKEYLLDLARQVDEQKAFNEQYKQTYEFIQNALDILTDSGKTFGEKMKAIFGGILNSFKKMLVDMTAQWLTSKLFGNNGGGSSSGGFLDFFKGIFGGGSSNSGGNGGFGSIFGGNAGGGIFNFGGGGQPRGALGNFNITNPFTSGGTSSGFGLAGGLSAAGLGVSILGSAIGGRAGGILSGIGSGIGIGATIGSVIPGIGTAIGAGVGAVVGLIGGLLGGDPKRKADKNENMPKLQQGFNEAFSQLRQLAADKNALFNDPAGTLARAKELRAQIEGGFGVAFQSKKYRAIAQQQIQTKLVEADQIIATIEKMSDEARTALDTDARLQTSFATGAYIDAAFLNQYNDFKRRNGMLPGAFTGKDTLPSMLATGEMVLNPKQIAQVISNAGLDPFKNAGIPNYAKGTFVAPVPTVAPASPSGASATVGEKQQIVVNIHLKNSGFVESDIEEIVVDSFDRKDVQVKVVETYDKGKSRRIN